MNRSIERVLTTHVGSLPRPTDLLDAIEAEQQDRPTDKDTRAARLRSAVKEVVRSQVEIGIDIICERAARRLRNRSGQSATESLGAVARGKVVS
jgi:methionine synthase II (cobalamin-independent)